MKRGFWSTVAAFVIVLLAVGGWKLNQFILSLRINAYFEQARPLTHVFGEQYGQMSSASAEQNASEIAEMETIRDMLRARTAPKPARRFHYTAVCAMNYAVEAFWAQRAGAPVGYVDAKLDLSSEWSLEMASLARDLMDTY